jgi:hypothetical protein
MATKPQDHSSASSPRETRDSFESKNANAEANTEYASGLIPLLWLGIPFVLILIYGYLS